MTNPPSPWMTRQEAADYLRVKPRTIDRMAREGKLTRFRMEHGDSPRFRRAEVASMVHIDEHVGEQPEALRPRQLTASRANIARATAARTQRDPGAAANSGLTTPGSRLHRHSEGHRSDEENGSR